MLKKINVVLIGALGKMGQAIQNLIKKDDAFGCIYLVDSTFKSSEGSCDFEKFFKEVKLSGARDLVIEFTTPIVTMEVALLCAELKLPLVTGTTGLAENGYDILQKASKETAILQDSNMSLGVNLVDALLPRLANTLVREGWDAEITELHHRMKKDSPSGTARRFAQTISLATGRRIIQGREKGHVSERGNEIFVHSVRGGTIPGEHTIYFMGPDEVIEIHHRALSNKIFALGAVKAAKWIMGKKPGLYSMLNVLGLKK
ncbi:4-hydroxy-tetrahydrodipicolinate reductase [Candidatus Falkowbacteria bacterium]|nr:4-hydroxy-tetrahydrodipicolinate reductase [Candidatus Falkowbacteria bacterium]